MTAGGRGLAGEAQGNVTQRYLNCSLPPQYEISQGAVRGGGVFWNIGNDAVGSMDGGSVVEPTYGCGEGVKWRIVATK